MCYDRRTGQRCVELDDADSISAASIIAYSLHRLPAHMPRYRVVFARGIAGLRLLFQLAMLKRSETIVIYSREGEVSPKDRLEDLLKVRRCMQSGGTLVLAGSSHIYESLYDC